MLLSLANATKPIKNCWFFFCFPFQGCIHRSPQKRTSPSFRFIFWTSLWFVDTTKLRDVNNENKRIINVWSKLCLHGILINPELTQNLTGCCLVSSHWNRHLRVIECLSMQCTVGVVVGFIFFFLLFFKKSEYQIFINTANNWWINQDSLCSNCEPPFIYYCKVIIIYFEYLECDLKTNCNESSQSWTVILYLNEIHTNNFTGLKEQ